MDDYNRYVTAVNKIFDYIEKMKAGWNNADNKNYIDMIDEFKGVVTSKASEYRKPPTITLEKTSAELEEEQEEELKKEAEKRKEQKKQQAANQSNNEENGPLPEISPKELSTPSATPTPIEGGSGL